MKTSITDAHKFNQFADMCLYCRMTTGGQHEWWCPLCSINTEIVANRFWTTLESKTWHFPLMLEQSDKDKKRG